MWIGNPRWPPQQSKFYIGPYAKIFWNHSSEIKKLFWQQTWLDCSVNSSFQNMWFCVNRKSKMAAIEGHSFNRGTYMKMKNIFFSDTRNRLHRKGTLDCHFYFLWIWNPSWLVSQVIVLTMGKGVTSLFSKTLKLHENKQAQMSLYFSEIQTWLHE